MAEVATICTDAKINGNEVSYLFHDDQKLCLDSTNCWIHFKSPEDRFKVDVGEKSLIDLSNAKSYVSNEYFLLPVEEEQLSKGIHFLASDSNQDKKFSKNLCIYFGKHEDLRWLNASKWFFNTGINLYSAYFLLLLSFFLLFSVWFRKSALGLSLLVYSFVSCVYLISFSEYPRAIFDPVLASGGVHFPLRLFQDLCLVFVFYNFYQKHDSLNIIKHLSWVYLSVIGFYVLLLLIGVKDYIYFSRIIIIMAPLVAAPMTIGTWFAFKLKDQTERMILIPLSILLLFFSVK